jgi:hypothetical protein
MTEPDEGKDHPELLPESDWAEVQRLVAERKKEAEPSD